MVQHFIATLLGIRGLSRACVLASFLFPWLVYLKTFSMLTEATTSGDVSQQRLPRQLGYRRGNVRVRLRGEKNRL